MNLTNLLPCLRAENESTLLVFDRLDAFDQSTVAPNVCTAELTNFSLSDTAHFDHGVVIISRDTAALNLPQVVARLRDQACSHCIIVTEKPTPIEPTEVIALGFDIQLDNDAVRIYSFHIDTYKPAPDWLNSNFWAHPELFDKYRW